MCQNIDDRLTVFNLHQMWASFMTCDAKKVSKFGPSEEKMGNRLIMDVFFVSFCVQIIKSVKLVQVSVLSCVLMVTTVCMV